MNPPLRHSASDLRSRSLEKAASAFVTRDVAKSREAHTPPTAKRKMEDEPHKSNILRKYKTKLVLTSASSGVTGLAISCSTIVGLIYAFGYNPTTLPINSSLSIMISTTALLVVVFSAVFLAISDASTTSASIAFYNSEKKRETWEYENYVEGEQREMVELYTNKGMTQADAENVVCVLSKYKDLFVDIMMAEELQLSPIDDLLPPLETGFSMFFSQVGFGIIPILPILLSETYHFHFSQSVIVLSSFLLSTLSLAFISYVKSRYTSTWWNHMLTNFICIFLSSFSAAITGSYLHAHLF